MVKLLRACVRMPWRKKAMKDVASCDKPRGDASNHYYPGMSEWRNPISVYIDHPTLNT